MKLARRVRRVWEWWRSGFVSTRGALELLGLPRLYTRAEVDDLMLKAVLFDRHRKTAR